LGYILNPIQDARRIVEALVQAVVGHVRSETTLRYA
jgi:hypothetical protein